MIEATVLAQVFLTPTHLAIAMEYAPAGDLYHHLLFQHSPSHCMSEEKARWMFQQLIIGLDYCHRRVKDPTALPLLSALHPYCHRRVRTLQLCSSSVHSMLTAIAGSGPYGSAPAHSTPC